MRFPNILYLHSHDTGRLIQPYGHAVPTPRLQRFAEEGVVFRNAFCAAPTCSPSRAALLTGRWAHQTGMLGLAHRGFGLADYSQHLAHTLRAAGYDCTLAGIQHVAAEGDRPADRCGYHRRLETTHQTRGRVVADFLRNTPPKQPFFLDVGLFETHRGFPEPACDSPLTDPRYVRPPAFLPDTPETRRDAAAFNTMALAMDRQYALVLDALDAAGLSDNTLVIVTTDHGPAYPFAKCNLTDAGIGVLLMARWPESPLFEPGRVVDSMVSHVDVFPTLCDLLGIDRPAWLQGESLRPILAGERDEVRDELFAEVTFHAAYEPQRCVRTRRYKYIRRYDARTAPVLPNCDDSPSKSAVLDVGWCDHPRPDEQLFDLALDPNEMSNLVDRPEMQAVRDDLRARLDRWMAATDDPILRGLPVPPPPGATLNLPDQRSTADPPIQVPA